MIAVYHKPEEIEVIAMVAKLRKKHNAVEGRNIKYWTGEYDKRVTEVYSPSFVQQLADVYGDKYKTKPKQTRRKSNVRKDS